MRVNLNYETVFKPNSSVLEDFVYLYVEQSAWDKITNNDELFLAYGKQYWMYRPFWDTLSEADQAEAAKLYSIDPERDLINA